MTIKYYTGLRGSLILLSFLLVSVSTLTAQQNDPQPYTEKPRKVKMPKYFVAELPKKAIPITGIRVIQAVWDSSRLGYLQKGMMNTKAEAVPSDDLTEFLQDYVTKQYKEGYKKSGSQLLLLVKELRINERTFFSKEFAFTKIKVEAWISPDGNNYKQVAAIDSVLSYGSMADVTSEHGYNIARGFYQLILAALKNTGEGKYLSTEEFSADALHQKARERFRKPILVATHFKEGAYMSFAEFVENSPSLQGFSIVNIDKKKVKIESTGAENREIQPWGICKSGEVYRYYDNYLIPIEKNNDGFVISDYIEKANRRNSGIFLATFFGGAIGGVIASSSGPKLIPVTNIPYIVKQQPEACAIDMETGEFTF